VEDIVQGVLLDLMEVDMDQVEMVLEDMVEVVEAEEEDTRGDKMTVNWEGRQIVSS